MILKIKDFVHGNSKWWILDNIEYVELWGTENTESDTFKKVKHMADITIVPKDDLKPKKIYHRTIVCHLKNKEIKTIIFSTFAYLCNDEGKTFERIDVHDTTVGEGKSQNSN